MRRQGVLALVLAGCATAVAVTPSRAPCPTHICCEEAKLASPRDTPSMTSTFHNASKRPVSLLWRDYDRRRGGPDVIPPLGKLVSSTFEGHLIVVANEALDCQAIYRTGQPHQVWDGQRLASVDELPAALADLQKNRTAYGETFRTTALAGFTVRISPEADSHPETAEALTLLEGNLI
jgi:hypothetical protein